MKKVYVPMCADLIHPGHINIINEASKLGEVIVGLVTDEAMARYKRLPYLTYEQRRLVVEHIKNVSLTMPQKNLDPTENLKKIRPEYLMHGTDWRVGVQFQTRRKVIKVLSGWGGKLVEVEYTAGVSSTQLNKKAKEIGITSNGRLSSLKRLLLAEPVVRLAAFNNSLKIEAESLKLDDNDFHGLCLSDSVNAVLKLKNDDSNLNNANGSFLNDVFDVTEKPVVINLGTIGKLENFIYNIKALERFGVSGALIQDDDAYKNKPLSEYNSVELQETARKFCDKINAASKSLATNDFIIIAGLKGLNLNKKSDELLERSKLYIDAGADGIMASVNDEAMERFLSYRELYFKLDNCAPLVISADRHAGIHKYNPEDLGVKMIIYNS